MGCSAGKQQSLDRIPSTSSTSDQRVKENGKTAHSRGYSNDSASKPTPKGLERRDTGDYSKTNGLMNGGDEKSDHQKNSLIDLSKPKKHKELPLSGPICNNNKDISRSQSDFFKMLDAKIAQGQESDDKEVT